MSSFLRDWGPEVVNFRGPMIKRSRTTALKVKDFRSYCGVGISSLLINKYDILFMIK